MKLRSTLILFLSVAAFSVDAQGQSRLIKQASHNFDTNIGFYPADSATYVYSYNRPGDTKTLMSYDTSVYWLNTGPGLMADERTMQTFETPLSSRIMTETKQRMDAGAWVNFQRNTMSYPASFGALNATKKDTITTENWNVFTSTWRLVERTVYMYNPNKDVSSELVQQYDDLNSKWVNMRSTLYAYSGSNLTVRTGRAWNNTSMTWVNGEQHTYKYAGSNMVSDSAELWNVGAGVWENVRKRELMYDGAGNNTQVKISTWDNSTSAWMMRQKDDYVYNGANFMTADTFSSWDDMTMNWVNNWLYLYTYDNANNVLAYTTKSPGPDSFLNYRKQEWTYNNNNQPLKSSQYEWNFVSSSYVTRIGSRVLTNYYYEFFGVGVKGIAETKTIMNIYPVPATHYFRLSLELEKATDVTMAVYDMQGRLVKQWSELSVIKYDRAIPVSDLPNGHYFVKVLAGNKEMTKALIIQN